MQTRLEFSIVVPVHNEADNVETLASEIAGALDGRAYEMIFVDDASTDETKTRLAALKQNFPTLRILAHRQNAGQSRAVRTGAMAARGQILGTLDGDGQNDPADLPDLYRRLVRADGPPNLGLVMGERTNRKDNRWRLAASGIGNMVRRLFLQDTSKDSACGIKVLPRDLFLALPYFDHMHRFMPVLVEAEGYVVESQPVHHRARKSGKSKYGNITRALVGFGDLRGVAWLARRRRQTGGIEEI